MALQERLEQKGNTKSANRMSDHFASQLSISLCNTLSLVLREPYTIMPEGPKTSL